MPEHDSLFEEDALPPAEEGETPTEEATEKPAKKSTRKSKQKSKPPKFEVALERLEEIVDEMEGGDLSLEESMKHFEEGAMLAAYCRKSLETIEKRVEVLVKKQGGDAWENFEEG